MTKLLRRYLSPCPGGASKVETLVLNLSINTTNTEGGAKAFNDKVLLSSLTACIHKGFLEMQDTVAQARPHKTVYGGLSLMLGMMINILEHEPDARLSVPKDSVGMLISLFLDNRVSMAEVRLMIQGFHPFFPF